MVPGPYVHGPPANKVIFAAHCWNAPSTKEVAMLMALPVTLMGLLPGGTSHLEHSKLSKILMTWNSESFSLNGNKNALTVEVELEVELYWSNHDFCELFVIFNWA